MSNRGFTLIETLVYLALFALIIGGFVAASYMLFETSDRNRSKAMMQEEQNFIIAKILRALDGSSSVAVSGGSTLTITKYSSHSVVVTTSGADVRLDGAVLNNSNVSVDRLLFVHAGGAGAPESVEIGLTLSARTPGGMSITQSASTTRYIRK